MPLSQNDPNLDYDGSWGDASRGWPSIFFTSKDEAQAAYVAAWRDVKVPYGSYVLVGTELRLETPELKILVEQYLSRGPHAASPNPERNSPMARMQRLYTTPQLEALMLDVFKTAHDKEWWVLDARGRAIFEDGDLEDKLVLIVTELAEAFEEYRNPERVLNVVYSLVDYQEDSGKKSKVGVDYIPGTKPEGFPIEMADAYIRILDLARARRLDDLSHSYMMTMADEFVPTAVRPGPYIWEMLKVITAPNVSLDYRLAGLLALLERTAVDFKFDLAAAISLKATYNRTRPAKHGGKRV